MALTNKQMDLMLEMQDKIRDMQEKLIDMEENCFTEDDKNNPDLHKLQEAIEGMEDTIMALDYFG